MTEPEREEWMKEETQEKSKMLNVNRYATKKTIAQGLLDIALLTANASQLKTVLDTGSSHPYFLLVIVLIAMSLLFQIVAGALLAYIAMLDINKEHQQSIGNRLNNFVGILIFLVTVLNIFIPVFGLQHKIN